MYARVTSLSQVVVAPVVAPIRKDISKATYFFLTCKDSYPIGVFKRKMTTKTASPDHDSPKSSFLHVNIYLAIAEDELF